MSHESRTVRQACVADSVIGGQLTWQTCVRMHARVMASCQRSFDPDVVTGLGRGGGEVDETVAQASNCLAQ